jgi:hypothetical protein
MPLTDSRKIASLPTVAEMAQMRRAIPKTPRPGAVRPARQRVDTPAPARRPETAKAEQRCRATVWRRDQGRSRASGVVVIKGHADELQRGEVAHIKSRSGSPAKKWDSSNCVLLTAEEHRLSDPRSAPGGKVLLRIRGGNARKVLTFTRLHPDGHVLWTRQSPPPPPPTNATR